jgi:enterochelin esterase-like enzyme
MTYPRRSWSAAPLVLALLFGTIADGLDHAQVRGSREPQSLLITALEKKVNEGDETAVKIFWAELAKTGTPILESPEGDQKDRLVTFVWRGDADTRNVVVFAGMNDNHPERNKMKRLATTDVWHRTYLIPGQARCTYSLSVNDSLIPFSEIEEKDIGLRTSTFKLDPLNHRGAVGGGSVLELPDAPDQPWNARQADVPHGKLGPASLKSSILKNQRSAWVYTPPGYGRAEKPYDLILMFDGPLYSLLVPTPTILDNLLSKNKIAPTVALILGNPTATSRQIELACYDPFASFVVTEAIPWVRENYNVTTDPSRTFICGASLGGLASAFIAFKHPGVFGNVISQSGSFWFSPNGDPEPEWLTRQFAASSKLRLRFDLVVGLFERGPTPGNAPDLVAVNRHLRDVLMAKGYEVHYREYYAGHDPLNWRGALPEALIAPGDISATNRETKD